MAVSNKTMINIKADREVKEAAQKAAKELGLSLSAVMNSFLKQFARDKELHLSVEPELRPEKVRLYAEIDEDIKAGRNMSGPFPDAESANVYLDSLVDAD